MPWPGVIKGIGSLSVTQGDWDRAKEVRDWRLKPEFHLEEKRWVGLRQCLFRVLLHLGWEGVGISIPPRKGKDMGPPGNIGILKFYFLSTTVPGTLLEPHPRGEPQAPSLSSRASVSSSWPPRPWSCPWVLPIAPPRPGGVASHMLPQTDRDPSNRQSRALWTTAL